MKKETIEIIKKIQKNDVLQLLLKDFDLEDFDSDYDILIHVGAALSDGELLADLGLRHQGAVEDAHYLVTEAMKDTCITQYTFIQPKEPSDDILTDFVRGSQISYLKASAHSIFSEALEIEVMYDLYDIYQGEDAENLPDDSDYLCDWSDYRTSLCGDNVIVLDAYFNKL